MEDKCTHVPTSLTHGSKPSSMLNDIVPPGVKGACNSIVQVTTTGLSMVMRLIYLKALKSVCSFSLQF